MLVILSVVVVVQFPYNHSVYEETVQTRLSTSLLNLALVRATTYEIDEVRSGPTYSIEMPRPLRSEPLIKLSVPSSL